ncbi:MAG: amidohydrolase family protein [Verrucomicrobia bacterium]|nr:amidohydrolase family protein [Verrucomicrobiota bacterium]
MEPDAASRRGPIDVHVHLFGNGKGGSNCWHRYRQTMRPFYRATVRDIGLGCDYDDPRFDELYLNCLVNWVEESSLESAVLLAYDWARNEKGEVIESFSDVYTPNEAVFLAAQKSRKFLAGVSIHPARKDAIDELERHAAAGAVLLKLLPCVQNVDCNLPQYRKFWKRLAELGLPLLAHTGGEFCVRSCRNDLKSPKCLRAPLEIGVNVIAAHCATRALPWDGDYFHEFVNMRRQYANLYGDLSPLSHITHLKSLEHLREAPERLLHGSDYPVVTAVFPSWIKGWITRDQMHSLRNIKNPLEKKIQLARAQKFPETTFTDLWKLLPPSAVLPYRNRVANSGSREI